MKHLLLIEDDKIDQMAFERYAKSSDFPYTYQVAQSITEAKLALESNKFDIIISDYFLGDGNAYEILQLNIDIPIIVTTGTGSEEIAVNALKMGAYDYLIKDTSGYYLKMLAITVKNVLQRYQSEKELKEYHTNLKKLVNQRTAELKKEVKIHKKTSEVLYKMNFVFKNSNEIIFITDKEGIITFINPKFTEVYGYTPEEVIGKVTPRILKNDNSNKEDFELFWGKLLNKNSVPATIYQNKCKNGKHIYIEGSANPVIDSDGTITGFLGIQRDITVRKRNEQIQKVLYNISNAVNTTSNIKQLINLIQVELGTIIDTTNFYVALYNKETKLISLPFFSDENDSFTTLKAGNTLTDYIIRTQKPLLASKQKLRELDASKEINLIGTDPEIWLGVPLKIGGDISGVLAVQSYSNPTAFNESDKEILVFVSDQIGLSIQNKKIESDLILALEKATESDRLKTSFLQNMSHEIRTPMNGILGFSTLLKNTSLTGEKQQSFIDIINKSGERMLRTLNDLMDISKLETGQVKLRFSETNINHELEILYDFFKPEAEAKNLVLNLKTTLTSAEVNLITDREKLYAILSNLIKNAIKYSNYGGIEVGYIKKDEFLEFYVKDTGIGIPKHRHIAIFDRFIQADIDDSKVYEGAGLGLSISKSYIEMLGGNIWVESMENEGSQFYFTIPFTTEKPKIISTEKETQMKDLNSSKKINILIVEDDESAQTYLSIVLKEMSNQLFYAKNGLDAIEICKNNPSIDLILMDIKMPIMGGYESTIEIRKFNKKVIIIAQTAYALTGDKEKAIEAGCNDYIAKPIQFDALKRIIQKHLQLVNC